MGRKTLTDAAIKALKPKPERYSIPDPLLPNHYLRVTPNGAKTFAVKTRDPRGKQVLATIGPASLLTVEQAREKAREAISAIKTGQDHSSPQSFQAVSEQWLKRHVDAKGLRSADETRRYLNKYILPAWGGRDFTSIRRGDVAALLDKIEDTAGPVAADNALKRISTICVWYQSRHDDYVSPVVKGMRRSSTKERARDRTLSDDDLRAVWKTAEANGTFGAFVRVLLLTGQRREKVASMKWADVSGDGVWTIPSEDREKGHAVELVLPEAALAIIRERPSFAGNPYVFAGRGGSHISGYSKAKAALDARVKNVAPWRLHDLRRTARSLMAKAGVRPDIAERVLGHAIQGVGGVYDRHDYVAQKAEALKRLAHLLRNILNPSSAPYLFYLDTKVRGK